MEGIRLYKQLLQHPLLQGMSDEDLGKVIAQTKFDFQKYPGGQSIAKEYDPCNKVLFLLNGTIAIQGVADDRSYKVMEEASSPWLIPIDNLFGLHQHYTRSYTAATLCHIIAIDKTEVMHLMEAFIVFRFNLLNIISALSQKKEREKWQTYPKSLEARVARFFLTHCQIPHGKKIFHIKMTQLANELNDSRLDISHALNRMQERGLLTLHRGRVDIPDIDALNGL